MIEGLLLISVFVAGLFFVLRCIHIVPARRQAVVERLGLYQRTLNPGFHWLWWPLEYVRLVEWSFVGQNGRVQRQTQWLIPFERVQMDIPPIQCLSKDKIIFSIDPTLTYTIVNVSKAVYESDDVLNWLYQIANQTLRSRVSTMTCQELQSPNTLGADAAHEVNQKFMDKGVTCNDIVIQRIIVDETILKREQEIFVEKRKDEMCLQQERARFELQKARAEQEMELQKLEQEHVAREHAAKCQLEMQDMRAKQERETFAAEAEVARRNIQGFTKDDALELRRLQVQSEMFTGPNTRVVYAPMAYWETRRVGQLENF